MNENVHQLAYDLAHFMGWHYPPNQDGWTAQLTNASGGTLWIGMENKDSRNPRVTITTGFGDLHEYAPYEARGGYRITCAATKTVPQIAKEIARRIYPEYYVSLQKAKDNYTAHRERMKGLATATLKFAAILNVPPPELTEKEEVRFHLGYLTSEHLWGDIEIDTRKVDIKLTDVPFHIAAVMLVPLGEYIRLHPKQDTEEQL
jgi:hypothetical protein